MVFWTVCTCTFWKWYHPYCGLHAWYELLLILLGVFLVVVLGFQTYQLPKFTFCSQGRVQSGPDPSGHGQCDSGSTLAVWTSQSQFTLAAPTSRPCLLRYDTPLYFEEEEVCHLLATQAIQDVLSQYKNTARQYAYFYKVIHVSHTYSLLIVCVYVCKYKLLIFFLQLIHLARFLI